MKRDTRLGFDVFHRRQDLASRVPKRTVNHVRNPAWRPYSKVVVNSILGFLFHSMSKNGLLKLQDTLVTLLSTKSYGFHTSFCSTSFSSSSTTAMSPSMTCMWCPSRSVIDDVSLITWPASVVKKREEMWEKSVWLLDFAGRKESIELWWFYIMSERLLTYFPFFSSFFQSTESTTKRWYTGKEGKTNSMIYGDGKCKTDSEHRKAGNEVNQARNYLENQEMSNWRKKSMREGMNYSMKKILHPHDEVRDHAVMTMTMMMMTVTPMTLGSGGRRSWQRSKSSMTLSESLVMMSCRSSSSRTSSWPSNRKRFPFER